MERRIRCWGGNVRFLERGVELCYTRTKSRTRVAFPAFVHKSNYFTTFGIMGKVSMTQWKNWRLESIIYVYAHTPHRDTHARPHASTIWNKNEHIELSYLVNLSSYLSWLQHPHDNPLMFTLAYTIHSNITGIVSFFSFPALRVLFIYKDRQARTHTHTNKHPHTHMYVHIFSMEYIHIWGCSARQLRRLDPRLKHGPLVYILIQNIKTWLIRWYSVLAVRAHTGIDTLILCSCRTTTHSNDGWYPWTPVMGGT